MQYRSFRGRDIAKALGVAALTYPEETRPKGKDFRRALQGKDPDGNKTGTIMFVCEDDDTLDIIAFCTGHWERSTIVVDLVAVHPQYQRQGVATGFIRCMEKLSASITGHVCETVTNGQHLGKKLGFVARPKLSDETCGDCPLAGYCKRVVFDRKKKIKSKNRIAQYLPTGASGVIK